MSTSLSAAPASASRGFSAFGLTDELMRAVAAVGYAAPRPIQAQTIPAVLRGRDVLGLAQTGTGKTAAFALPILDRLIRKPGPGPRALVVAPTRELAIQIDADFRSLARFTKIRTVTVYGGVSARNQIRDLARQPHVVIACPGRLLDLHGQRVLRLDRVETLVLDEADHMFDMGFLPDIRRILAALPKKRQNLLFSATMPREIRSLAQETLSSPVVAELAHSRPAETIEHALYPVVEQRKRDLLEHLIRHDQVVSALVFTRTKHRARRLAKQLSRTGHRAVALQGDMSQNARDRAMKGFRSGHYDVLVATDIVARGIDVEQISHVFNFDVPSTPDAYTHRIGRTGRAERDGKAYTFVTVDDSAMVHAVERQLAATIPRCRVDGFEEVTLLARGDCSAKRPGSRKPSPQPRGRARAATGSRGQTGRGRSGHRPSDSRASDAPRGRPDGSRRARGESDSTPREGQPRRGRRGPARVTGEDRPGGSRPRRTPEGPRATRDEGSRPRRGGAAAPTRGNSQRSSSHRKGQHADAGERRGAEDSGRRLRRRRNNSRRRPSS